MEELDITGIFIRVSVMYLYALLLVRISGKQTLGQLTAMDFVVTLIIGDLVDDVVWADVPLLQGLVAFAVVVCAHMVATLISSRNLRFYRLATAPERLLVENGKLLQRSLQQERMRPDDLQSELRTRGEEHLKEIKESWLEPNGQVSVIRKPVNKPLPRKDKHLLG